jgi:hypothetical protein
VGVIFAAHVDAGQWGGKHLRMTFQWERCDATGICTLVATHQGLAWMDDYAVQQADVGFRLRVAVTASNDVASTTATSNLTAPIVPPGAWFTTLRHGQVLRFRLFSPAVHGAQPVYVYLPSGYDARDAKRRPHALPAPSRAPRQAPPTPTRQGFGPCRRDALAKGTPPMERESARTCERSVTIVVLSHGATAQATCSGQRRPRAENAWLPGLTSGEAHNGEHER